MKLLKLCTPALVYLIISVLSIFYMISQGMTSGIVLKAVWMAFWTFVLNIICNAGYEAFSWFLVLLPFILAIIMVICGMMVLKNAKNENFRLTNARRMETHK